MQRIFFALFLCAATPAVCQSAARIPAEPGHVAPPAFFRPWESLSMVQSAAQPIASVPLNLKAGLPRQLDDARIDPKIIAHPSQPKLEPGAQRPGTTVANNEFPGLQLLPIKSSAGKTIPTQWPHFKLQEIPTQWPLFTLSPVTVGAQPALAQPAKAPLSLMDAAPSR